jgi:hypothetical protein
MMDFFKTVGSALTNRIDISAVLGRYFPTHDRFTSWRDAGGHCSGKFLPDREALSAALTEMAVQRGATRVDEHTCVVEFADPVSAERFRSWLRPE